MGNVPPIVSVLMTCYNREKYIVEAIESVLASTLKDFELIIVDDHSSDNTVAVAKQYEQRDDRIKVYQNEKNLTDYINRNKAASYAKGKYLKYLDSDDIIYSYGLEVFVSSMEKFPDAAFGLCSYYDSSTPYPARIEPGRIYMEHFYGFGHFLRAPGSAIIRRDIFEELQGFSGKKYIGDTELWLKLATKYPMVKINPGIYWARHHQQSQTKEAAHKMVNEGRAIIKSYLDSADCPLNEMELKKIKKTLFKRSVKSKLIKLLP